MNPKSVINIPLNGFWLDERRRIKIGPNVIVIGIKVEVLVKKNNPKPIKNHNNFRNSILFVVIFFTSVLIILDIMFQ